MMSIEIKSSKKILTAAVWSGISLVSDFVCPLNLTVEIPLTRPIRSISPFAITSSSGILYNCHFRLELPALIEIVFAINLPLKRFHVISPLYHIFFKIHIINFPFLKFSNEIGQSFTTL